MERFNTCGASLVYSMPLRKPECSVCVPRQKCCFNYVFVNDMKMCCTAVTVSSALSVGCSELRLSYRATSSYQNGYNFLRYNLARSTHLTIITARFDLLLSFSQFEVRPFSTKTQNYHIFVFSPWDAALTA